MGTFIKSSRFNKKILKKLETDKNNVLDVVQLVEHLKLKYVDKRSSGGALWVIGGTELTATMEMLGDSGFRFRFKEGGGRSSGYKDAWWYKPSHRANQAEELRTKQQTSAKALVSPIATLRVDFSHPELCAQTRPLTCTISGQRVTLRKQQWSQLLIDITEYFISTGNPNITELEHKPIYGSRVFFLPSRYKYGTCSQLSNGKWIYVNYNPQTIVKVIRNLCQHCGVDLDEVIITYKPKDSEVVWQTQECSSLTCVASAVLPKLKIDPTVLEKITRILSARFTNGFRLNSPIELTRFRTFALHDLGEDICMPDEELKNYISACGTIFDGKVYSVSKETKNQIKELIEDYFSNGAQVVFYSEFYAKHKNWLFDASVISENMLIGILRNLFPRLSFTQTYFGYTAASVSTVLESEILRVWGEEILLTYDQLAERLPYIPIERIKYALAQNANFIWNSMETFSHINRIDINEDEREAIREFATRECNTHGYVPIMHLPLENIEERNYELSNTALYNAVYRICLSDKFNKKGRIITRKGDVVDALTIMKDYCRSIDICSLKDLFNYEKEQTGDLQRWISLEAANAVLVRIDKETYVADKFVHFNVDLIDEAIGLVVKGDYLPLKSFTTFGTFPDCGQTWNLFLLESYCRRFSRKFRFDTQSVNSRNIGVVIRNSCSMDYIEIMSDAVAKSNVPLKDIDVGRFLFDNGYTGKSTNAKIREIIERAKAIRGERI